MYLNNIIFCFLFLVIVITCNQTESSTYQFILELNDDIPDSIIQKTNNYIKSKVGGKYFNEFIKYDVSNSGLRKRRSNNRKHSSPCEKYLYKPHYYFVYNLQISKTEEISASIEFITDTLGNIIPECYVDRIPKCPENDCWDFFPLVKKEDAILIAKNGGLEEGIKDWIISFHYNLEDFEDYVWNIKSTLSRGGTYYGQGASGKRILISAIDGSIIRRYDWSAIH